MPTPSDPLFTVLLPTHNRADVVGFAIRSALAQTEPRFELLVVGDGCTDSTADVVRSFSDPRIRWFDLPKAPSVGYANRDIALKQARGRLIAYLSHDDLIFPDHLELIARSLDETGAEWTYSRPIWVNPDGLACPFAVNLSNPPELELFLTQDNVLPSTCVGHTRECFEKYGDWPTEFPRAGDWRLWVRIIEGGGRTNFAVCREPTCLRFRALWKGGATWGPSPLRVLEQLADTQTWWPDALRLESRPGVTEQQAIWESIEAEPAAWTHRLRGGVHVLFDHLALT